MGRPKGSKNKINYRTCIRCGEKKLLSEYSTKSQIKKRICNSCKLPAQEKLYNTRAERMYAYYQRHPDKNPNYTSLEDRRPKDGHKLCSKCKQKLPLDCFGKSKQNKSGYCSQCKSCKKEYKKTHKAKPKPYKGKPTTVELEKMSCKRHRRIARKQRLPATFNYKQWVRCKEHFEYRCAYCGAKHALTQDHFIALNNNGEYTKNNIIPACHMCNSLKRDLDFFEWYPKQEFYSKAREEKILNYLHYNNKFQQIAL